MGKECVPTRKGTAWRDGRRWGSQERCLGVEVSRVGKEGRKVEWGCGQLLGGGI